MVKEPAGTLIITTPTELLNSEVGDFDILSLLQGVVDTRLQTRRCRSPHGMAAPKDASVGADEDRLRDTVDDEGPCRRRVETDLLLPTRPVLVQPAPSVPPRVRLHPVLV